jgi:hypothetical protein
MHSPALGMYILNEAGEPVPASDTATWGRFMESGERQLANDLVGDIRVSTVFLGIDHGYGFLRHLPDGGPVAPVLWETMVFGAPEPSVIFGKDHLIARDLGSRFDALSQRRYRSRDEALQGHAEVLAAVHRLRELLPPDRPPGQEPGREPDEPPGDDQGGGLPPG